MKETIERVEERNMQLLCHGDGRLPWISPIHPITVPINTEHEEVIKMVRDQLYLQHDDLITGCNGTTHNIQIYQLSASCMG